MYMNRFCKILAVVLATLMLVTMATACKKADDDINSMLAGNNSSIGGNNGGNGGDTGNNGDTGNTGNNGNTGNSGNTGNAGNSGISGNTGNAEQDKVIQEFDATKKYDFASNPLLAASKPINHGSEVGFDIDTTGFVKNNIKIKDLKGKTLTLITALEQANFIYKGANGEQLNEWTWFESLKKTYGLNIKYIESNFYKAPQQIITYMNAGKALDVVPTHRSAFPQYLLLSAPLDPYINLQYVDNSPGIDKRTMEQMKWDGTYRCIAPIGAVDVIWYNETMVASLGMPDPHKLWKEGKWNWDAFKSFQVGVPAKSPNGTTALCPFSMSEGDAWTFWALTNGVQVFEIKTTNNKSTIVSNFEDPKALEAWNFYAGTVKGVDYVNRRNSDRPQTDIYRNGSCIMSGTQYLMNDYSSFEYAKSMEANWVPWPGKTGDQCMCTNYGNTMMLPKKTKNQANIPYAVKFMELWASRFTEAINDYLQEPYYNFSHAERVEYFDFAAKTNYFNVGSRIFDNLTGSDLEYYKQFTWSFYNPNYNTATQAEQLKNLVNKALSAGLEYGT